MLFVALKLKKLERPMRLDPRPLTKPFKEEICFENSLNQNLEKESSGAIVEKKNTNL